MIGIIGAMDTEVNELKSAIKNVKIYSVSGIDFYCGEINYNQVVVAKSGVGKVFAAVCAEIMILNYNVDKIIHIGIAGSLTNDLKIGDVVIASSVVHHDVDITAFGKQKGVIDGIDIAQIPCSEYLIRELEKCVKSLDINYKIGTIATGDKFIVNSDDKKTIANEFGALAVEMESAGTGQVCYINNVEFAAFRVISDGGDEKEYINFKNYASTLSVKVILEYLKGTSKK